MRPSLLVILLFSILCNCSPKQGDIPQVNSFQNEEISEDSLLTLVQYQTFNYFWEGAEPISGLARERIHMDGIYPQNDQNVITSGGSGFGIMAILAGIERGFISREEGFKRMLKIMDFLENADRFHGVWPHWWYGDTGKIKPFSQKDDGGDLVETSFLIQGLLCARQYFMEGNEEEQQLADKINKLWLDVEWNWHTRDGEHVLYWHWSPNYGWDMNFPVGGYNECLIMYILAASSPTYPIQAEVYHKGWARDGAIISNQEYLGFKTVLDHYETNDSPVGPLFWAHYSYLGLNPKKLHDRYADYWELNKNHALIHYTHCLQNPNDHKGYGSNCWGLSSSYSINGYSSHRPDQDLGVISPTAALSSFPYTPEESMLFLKFLYNEADCLVGEYGPYDAFSIEDSWYLPRYLAIDQGPIPVMIENYRTGFIWNLFMSCPEIQDGLQILGFE